MKAHLIGTKDKVICKDQGQISGSCFSKDGCFGGISVSQTHLVYAYNGIKWAEITEKLLTLSQTTNFRLFQTKKFANENFKFD